MRAASLVVLYLCAAVAIVADAAPLSPERARALREQFKAHQQQTRTWSASFTQTLTLPGMRQAVVSAGTLVYRVPGQLRLDFARPPGEFVLVIGDRLFLRKTGEPLEELSLSRDLAARPFQSLLDFLRGEDMDQEMFFTPEISNRDAVYLLVLKRKPDAPEEVPKQITNTFDAESLEVREVVVELPTGGTLKYRFDAVVRNRAVDGRRFAPPESR